MRTAFTLFLSAVAAAPFPDVGKGAPDVKIVHVKPECPQIHGKDFLTPQLMVPISASEPDKMFGYVREPIVTPNDICTLFNLHIPVSYSGKACAFEFMLPQIEDALKPYTHKGDGHFSFSWYVNKSANVLTTWNSQPKIETEWAVVDQVIVPGEKYVLEKPAPGSCWVDKSQTYLAVGARLCSNDTTLKFLEDWGKCPAGFFVEVF
ncbi:hypothetical protein P171DRAFT_438310 [Karstenula rhodostoma CBS 690.94]|uniref:Ubiquitin 3 binding protein But2 C-terminal domain-containing protein n=1 Tax=Karstenula rhodostoma CBS 690.94 TaxID=1392251 RepID=A0A9P4PWP1_9PLEO|nr:hypothetical protein P171DRAFT_438310 [Karstenula rhodostoma CBS 690.94]